MASLWVTHSRVAPHRPPEVLAQLRGILWSDLQTVGSLT